MRISDWSSDVCSSDLRDRRQHVGKACALQCQIAKQQRELLRLRIICAAEAERRFDIGQLMAQPVIEAHLVLIERADQEVGRAPLIQYNEMRQPSGRATCLDRKSAVSGTSASGRVD